MRTFGSGAYSKSMSGAHLDYTSIPSRGTPKAEIASDLSAGAMWIARTRVVSALVSISRALRLVKPSDVNRIFEFLD